MKHVVVRSRFTGERHCDECGALVLGNGTADDHCTGGLYSTMDEAREAIEAAESDVRGDMGDEGWEAGAHDVIVGIALHSCTREIGDEILRTELGITRAEADPWS